MNTKLIFALSIALLAGATTMPAQKRRAGATACGHDSLRRRGAGRIRHLPARDPLTPGYVKATELPDSLVNFRRPLRQLHRRADAQSGARDDGAGGRAARHRPQFRGSSRPTARFIRGFGVSRAPSGSRSEQPREAGRHDQRRRALYAARRCGRAAAVHARHDCALHRRRRRT